MGSSILLFLLNARWSIQFTGGLQIKINRPVDGPTLQQDVTEQVKSLGYQDFAATVASQGEYTDILLSLSITDDKRVSELTKSLETMLLNKQYIQSPQGVLELSIIGPSVGDYIKSSAIYAIIFGFLFLAIYMIFAFGALRDTISPAVLAFVIIVTTLFDVTIPAGAYGFLMMINQAVQVDTVFIIAILTIMGYSVNDTMIIFDRIRENIKKQSWGQIDYAKTFDAALIQTLRRSIGTSLSTLFVVIAMYIFGESMIKMFAYTMGVGIIAWTFSSIFISAPLAYLFLNKHSWKKIK